MKQSGCNDGYSQWMEDMGKLSKKEKNKSKLMKFNVKRLVRFLKL